jgi:hypothetical protein
MSRLVIEAMTYSSRDLEAWRRGTYRMLERSAASDFLKRILCEKACCRPGRRFFGEACVAARLEHQHGWYGSFKWLTSRRYLDGRGLDGYAAEFSSALREHFDDLERLQDRAQRFRSRFALAPMPPDLWLIANGEHRFIEVKLPGDSVSDRQLAGMALIKRYLRGNKPTSVSVVQLHPESEPAPSAQDLQSRFREFYRAA